LRVFPQDTDLPSDALNSRVDREFVPMAKGDVPRDGEFEAWQRGLLTKLRQQTFHHFPERIPPAQPLETNASGVWRLGTEGAIAIRLRAVRTPISPSSRVWVVATSSGVNDSLPAWLNNVAGEQDAVYVCEPRGSGGSGWTRKNPPNYVERSHYLLGRTTDSGRVWDLAATARHVRARHGDQAEVYLAGEGAAAVLAVYAALLESDVAGLVLYQPAATHMSESAPALLNVLRVCDLPEAVGMLAPRPVTLVSGAADWSPRTAAVYRSARAEGKFVVRK
jgi:hypothetical protein